MVLFSGWNKVVWIMCICPDLCVALLSPSLTASDLGLDLAVERSPLQGLQWL